MRSSSRFQPAKLRRVFLQEIENVFLGQRSSVPRVGLGFVSVAVGIVVFWHCGSVRQKSL